MDKMNSLLENMEQQQQAPKLQGSKLKNNKVLKIIAEKNQKMLTNLK